MDIAVFTDAADNFRHLRTVFIHDGTQQMDRHTIKDLTLMLMYLTSWEESLVPGIRKKPDRAGIYPKARLCWKGYDFDILNELTDEGLVEQISTRSDSVNSFASLKDYAQNLLRGDD